MIYDLLIIGGGINGAGVARDAAGRGLKVVLLEQDDLAAGTSSASTKLLHGGLRYLENYEFRMVASALRERDIILRIASHLSRHLRFVLPDKLNVRPRWLLRAGLMLYDVLGFGSILPRSGHNATGLYYSDGWVDDARLVVLNALDAQSRGSVIRTREGAVQITPHSDKTWCVTSTTSQTYRARCVINAAGPWARQILDQSDLCQSDTPDLRLVRGSHLILPRLYEGEDALLLQQQDGRIVFTIPYEQDFTLIGTTEAPHHVMDNVSITVAERDYLLEAVGQAFGQEIDPSSIVADYAGVRPLLDDGKAEARRVTRDYRLLLQHFDSAPLISVLGGKLTSYRLVAEKTVDLAMTELDRTAPHWTAEAALPGSEKPFPPTAMPAFLPGMVKARYARLYGTRAPMIYGAATNLADMGPHIAAGLYGREVDYLMRYEWAITPDDILKRRTKLYLRFSATEVAALATYMTKASHG
ncbi:MAG: glycerol-3-phosphate dehydrogenase [Pseudomonadota bacterium]